VDLSKVNDVLQKAANIKEITIFDPTDIKLEKITESNTALKIVTWAVAILAFGLIIFCIVSCCPVQIFAMLKATFKAILALLTLSGASPGTTDGMKYRSMIVNIFGTEIM
jgi:hypothetical protein